jgi:hypothetical protein
MLMLLLACDSVYCQKKVTTVGIQFKPIFPVDFVGTGKILNDTAGVHFETELNSGFSTGLIIRHNFTDLLAIETGINYIRRKYTLAITDSVYKETSQFRVIGYEIPVSLMVYARLGEKIYINGSMGPSLDMFASSVQSNGESFSHVAFRNHVFQPALNANIGWEYRTEKSGNLYLGISYHRPFSFIYLSKTHYDYNGKDITMFNELLGNFLTLDFRYFFHEEEKR